MNHKEFNARLRELIDEIAKMPKDQQKQLSPLVNETKQRHQEVKESADRITKSLVDLRICLKYLLFDLEATRRERDSLKKMLDDQSTDDDKPNKAEGEM